MAANMQKVTDDHTSYNNAQVVNDGIESHAAGKDPAQKIRRVFEVQTEREELIDEKTFVGFAQLTLVSVKKVFSSDADRISDR